jgi:predicted O-methyltransferase YrrM
MKRSFQHWNFRYLVNRIIEKNYRRTHPGVPWLAPAAVEFLTGYLCPTDTMLEFGSGRSTLWFAERVSHITSVEHNPEWYSKIEKIIHDREIKNVTYLLHPRQEESVPAAESNYVKATKGLNSSTLDIVLVDGTYRAQCVLQSLPLLKTGGILVIDNVNRYLPSDSVSPNSRSFTDGPIDSEWQEVLEKIGDWRFFWTSNGVSDTSFYFKQ